MNHQVFILGSAQDGGLPQLGARAEPDLQARGQATRRRLGPSICVLAADGRTLLIDVSPDIKLQESRLLRVGTYAARPHHVNPFDTILLTHAHMGHYAGLVHFGRAGASTRALPCHVTPRMAQFLRTNAPWELLVRLDNLRLCEFTCPETEIWPGLRVRTFTVPHRGEYSDTLGVSINDRLLYVPDIDSWEAWPAARDEIERHPVSLLDATFYDADELPGRDMREVPHPLVTDTIARFHDLTSTHRIILTHLNHTNPLADPASAAARRVRDAGFEIAGEMMSWTL